MAKKRGGKNSKITIFILGFESASPASIPDSIDVSIYLIWWWRFVHPLPPCISLTVTLACCCVLGCLVTSVSLELHSTLKYLKKEIYLRQPDRKVPEIDGIWNLLRFPICSSLKLIKHSLLAGGTPFFIIRILAAKNISIYSPVSMLYAATTLDLYWDGSWVLSPHRTSHL